MICVARDPPAPVSVSKSSALVTAPLPASSEIRMQAASNGIPMTMILLFFEEFHDILICLIPSCIRFVLEIVLGQHIDTSVPDRGQFLPYRLSRESFREALLCFRALSLLDHEDEIGVRVQDRLQVQLVKSRIVLRYILQAERIEYLTGKIVILQGLVRI